MAFVAGKNSVFKLDNSGGSITDLSSYITDVSVDFGDDTAETTAYGDTSKEYILTLADGSLSVTALFDATLLAHLGAVRGSSSTLSYEFYPDGTTSGKPKINGECILTSMSPGSSVGGTATLNFALQCSGAQTIGTA